jgi:predicted GNAT family N-acyltransferase
MPIEAIEHLTDEQVKDLHRLYQSEWWTEGRSLSDVERILQHSDIIVAFCDSVTRELLAFARVLTDYVYTALILDVIVEASHRGSGIGRSLMDSMLDHPALADVSRFELSCLPDLVPFYRRWGFTDDLGEARRMLRTARTQDGSGRRGP